MLLSIAMIVKNEERNIERCLKALQVLNNKIEYEIIIVDTGSTDSTISIAKKYTEKVYEHNWTGNFAEMRNISIGYCKGKWILILDADEVLESEDEFINFFKSKESECVNCATVRLKNFISDNEENYLIGSLVRVFRNNKYFYYTGRVHEQPNILPPIACTNITIQHYGYSREDYKLMEYKYERNKKLLLEDLEEGKDLIYTYFQLAQTYSMANKNNEAFVSIKKSFDLVKNEENQKKYLYIYHFYSREELERQNYEKVIQVCEKALKHTDEHLDFYYMILKAYLGLNKYIEAKKYFEKYFELYNKLKNGFIVRDISVINFSFCRQEEVLRDEILCKHKLKEYNNIPILFDELKKNKIKEQLKEIYIYSLVKNKMSDKISEYLKEKQIDDEYIQSIINVIKKIRDESLTGDVTEEIGYFLNLDFRLDQYIERVLLKSNVEKNKAKIDLNIYYLWKAEYIQEVLISEEEDFSIFEELALEDVKKYISFVSSNYKCLALLYEYTEKNFMSSDIKLLNLITSIEEVLLFNPSIEDNQYKNLISRTFINKINVIRKMYNNIIFCDKSLNKLINRSERIWIDIREAMLAYKYDKLMYIRNLKEMLKNYPEYNRLIKLYLKDIGENNITKEMIKEKEYLLNVVQNLVNENRIAEALEILSELKKIFKFDPTILNYLGVVNYMNGNYDEAINNLALSDVLEENNFDTLYNMACVFEFKGSLEMARYYYQKSYDLCDDNQLKQEIYNIINKIK
ncbi:glycosyltransferase [Clostridium sp. SM-530-WT-3G]|uniref:glycosyltransferase n=1 Tax=Clostridium sp. SM-530-WT-3G TaxID=2725303 RepID=UPI00145E6944|nr:glycosyltransferase [Clostridium sp. SM-530-WT-3G]NME82790.1 glycosyltransferase [Clostridium sp. SM-530-WT-3G]